MMTTYRSFVHPQIKETMLLSFRGYKVWWKEIPELLISTGLYAIVKSLAPYVTLRLLANLIDEIAGPCNLLVLKELSLKVIIITAVLALTCAVLERWKKVQWSSIWHVQNNIFLKKLFSMDYAQINNHHTQDLRFQIWQNNNSGAWGLYKLLFCFEDMVNSIVSIGGAIVLTIPLFVLQVPASGERLVILNSPLFIILIIAIMFLTTYLAPFFSVKAGNYWVKYSEEHKMGNRLFSFWLGVLGSDRSRALDVRIYRQDILSKKNLEQNNPFNAKAKLPKAAIGPMGALNALSGAISQMFVAIGYLFICLKALGGAFGVGSVTQYIGALTALSSGVSLFFSTIGILRNNTAFLRTSFEFLDMPGNMDRGNLSIEKNTNKKYIIEFRNVSFMYPSQKNYALQDVSLTFNIGQRLAVVGMNGSGKTTFIMLLCRLYDPTEGQILLNNIDIREYNYHEYMSIFSVVFQDFRLLPFELGKNVAAKELYNKEKVESCLKRAGFGERFSKMSQGLSTVLYRDFDDNGVEVSGGEAQKIALARALYKDAPFIILDEPTAALDPIAEFEMYSKMSETVGDKTAVFISHRLSSCRFCQDIIVFHEGHLIQRGNHAELVAYKNGKYYELWNAQAQYYT